jgi:hypothetical protein
MTSRSIGSETIVAPVFGSVDAASATLTQGDVRLEEGDVEHPALVAGPDGAKLVVKRRSSRCHHPSTARFGEAADPRVRARGCTCSNSPAYTPSSFRSLRARLPAVGDVLTSQRARSIGPCSGTSVHDMAP